MTCTTSLRILITLSILSSVARGDFLVTGHFQYQKRPQAYGVTGTPCWNNLESLPIRFAHIQVINASTNAVMQDDCTDGTGNVSTVVVSDGLSTVNVFIRCYSEVCSGHFGAQLFNVTDGSAVEYSVRSTLYRNWNTQQTLNFGTVTAGGVTYNGVVGHPFNDYDNLVWMLSYFESQAGYHPSVPLTILWPTYDPNQPQTSFYDPFGHQVHINYAYDTDNDSAEIHEMGHYILESYVPNTTGGAGGHDLTDSNEDPAGAFGEGFPTFFEGVVRRFRGDADAGWYARCEPSATTEDFGYRFEDGYGLGPVSGEGSEAAITMALWDLIDTSQDHQGVDDDPVDGSFLFQGLLTGEQLVWYSALQVLPTLHNNGLVTLESLWNGFSSPVDWGNQQQLLGALVPWGMVFENDASEPDNSIITATPLAQGVMSPVHTLYYASGGPGAPGDGDTDFFSFVPTVNQSVTIYTTYPNSDCLDVFTDVSPKITVRDPSGATIAQSQVGGVCGSSEFGEPNRNATVTFTPASSGTYTFEVYSSHPYRKTGSYQVIWQ